VWFPCAKWSTCVLNHVLAGGKEEANDFSRSRQDVQHVPRMLLATGLVLVALFVYAVLKIVY